MKLADLFPKKYMNSGMLQGHAPRLTIASIVMREMRNPTDKFDAKGKRMYETVEKPVVYFRDKTAGVVLNITRTRQLAEILGIEDTEQAIGRDVILYAKGNELMFRAAPVRKVDQQTGEVVSDAANPTD